MKRSVACALFAVLLLAAIVRLSPLLRGLYWGADFGEHLALTRALLAQGIVGTAYGGWGATYPFFPGLFVANAAFAFAGLPVALATGLAAPLLASFVVLPVFLITVRVTHDEGASLLAAGFIAVASFHAYPTSHAIPAALADLFLAAALLAFLSIRRSPSFVIPVVLSGFAIVVTHHLTAYVLLILLGGATLVRAAVDPRAGARTLRWELASIATVGAATLAYWRTLAPPLWELIENETPLDGVSMAALLVAGVAAAPTVAWLRRRRPWRLRPRARTVRGTWSALALAVVAMALLLGAFVAFGLPGTSVRPDARAAAFYAPVLALVSFAAAGRRSTDFSREGPEVSAWFAVLVASVAVGAAVAPDVLIPYRHAEYLVLPLAVFVGAGVRWLTLGASRRRAAAVLGATVLLLAASGATAFPPSSAFGGFDESIGPRAVEGGLWLRDNADGLVAADHRMSAVAFGFGGVDATWDRETAFWHTEDLSEALASMEAVPLPGGREPVAWVVVDEGTRRGVQLTPFQPATPLLAAEEAKFTRAPFHRLFDSGAVQVYYLNRGLA